MSDRVETLDDILGPQESLDDILAGPRVELFGRKPMMDYFMEGFRQGVGDEPFGEHSQKLLREAGILSGEFKNKIGEVQKNDLNLMRAFNDVIIAPTATALETMFRVGQGTVYGFSKELEQIPVPIPQLRGTPGRGLTGVVPSVEFGIPKDATPAALAEAFPVGRGTGLPTRPQSLTPALRIDLDAAAELGAFGELPGAAALRALEPEQPLRISSSGTAEGRLVPEMPADATLRPVDINEAARIYAPEVFERYDALTEQRRALSDVLDEMKATDPVIIAAESNISDILGRVRGVETRLTNRARERLEEARAVLEEAQRVDSPEQNAVRLQRNAIDADLRDMAPEVARSYRDARDSLSPEGQMEIVRRELAPEEIQIRPKEDGTFEVQSPRGTLQAANENEAIALARQQVATPVINLSQRAPTIRQTVAADLRAVGRPAGEAEAAASLVAERYAARGERLGIPAQELFDRDFPSIRAGGPSPHRGMYRTAQNELTLFDKADASTFIHEMGHRWYKELLDDAALADAPTSLVRDRDVVREWLADAGAERAQQERFARGFERYLMEGVAPSSRLARVFEQFKDWLTRIYQSVSRLRSPINDDIRGVYDRLLSVPNRDPVIAGTRERQSVGDISNDLAVETPAVDGAAAANTVRGLRDRLAENLSLEVQYARRQALRGPERVSVPRPESTGDGGGSGGPSAAPRVTTVGEGRTAPTGKSTEVQPDGRVVTSNEFVNAQGEIVLENLLEAADAKMAIRLAAESSALNVPRRGILSDGETLRLADEMGMRPRDIDRRAVGEAFNAEQVTASIKLYRQSDIAVRDAMAKASVGDIEAIKDYALARERHLMIMEQMAGIRAEAGRSLRAFRQLAELKEVDELNEFFQKTARRDMLTLRLEAELGIGLKEAKQLAGYLRGQGKVRTTYQKASDFVAEGFLSWLFSGWETHAFNIAGSTIPLAGHIVETAGAAGVARVRGALGLGSARANEFVEVNDLVHGIVDSAKQATIAAGKALWDEEVASGRGPLDKYTRAIPSTTVNVAGIPMKLGGSTVRLPLRFLGAEDVFFKTIAKNEAMNQLARRQARNELPNGTDAEISRRIDEIKTNPSDAMVAAADEFARYQTFQKDLGEFGKSIQRMTDAHPLLKIVFPVVRTGFNLLKYAGERSPFGLLMSEARDRTFGHYGEAAQNLQISRMAVGNAVFLSAVGFTLEGLLTGGGPADAEGRAMNEAAGRQPYSVKLGDLWVDFRRLSPVGNQLMMAADIAEISAYAVTKEDKDQLNKAIAMTALSLWRNVGDSLALRGASDLFEAMQDWRRYGPSYMNRMAGTAIPNFVAQSGALFDDPVMRDTRSLLDTMKARLGMRSGLAVVRDIWGEPVPATPGVRRMQDRSDDPVNAELRRLGTSPTDPSRKWGEVELTPHQYDDYARLSGRLAKELLDNLIGSPVWKDVPNGIQIAEISQTVTRARKIAKGEMLGLYPELIQAMMDAELKKLED